MTYVDVVLTGVINFGLFGAVMMARYAIHEEGPDAFLIHGDERGLLLFAEGCLLAVAVTAFRCALLVRWGKASVYLNPQAWPGTLGMAGALVFGFSGVALFEEGLFRGYLLQVVARRYPLHVSVAGTSLLFGLLHFASYSWSRVVWLGILNASALGAILSGFVLKTHSLMLALGYHLSWNAVQALLWDSRRLGDQPWVRLEVQGGLLAGDPASPETGLATTLAILLTLAFLLVRFGAAGASRGANGRGRDSKDAIPSLGK